MLNELKHRFEIHQGSSTGYYCFERITVGNNVEKGKFVLEILFWLVNIPLFEACINIVGVDCTVQTGNYPKALAP